MKKILCALLMFFCINLASAQTWQPSPGHTQIPIWPADKMPDALSSSPPETFIISTHHLVAGKTWTEILNVSKPTMTLYYPKKNRSHAAVIVFPGGGFNGLAIDLEGTEICHWITSEGMTCVLLKYRVPDSGPAWHNSCHCNIHPKAPTALEDAQRTISLVRYNAKKWHIDSNKIGVIGFSAGGYMVAEVSADFKNRAYKSIDAVDHESCRPDFAMAIYPGHMQKRSKSVEKGVFVLNPNIHFTKDTPPTFIVQAENDPEDNIDNSLLYYIALKNAGVPVEMHLYATGGHAFGLRRTHFAITQWPQLAETWLQSMRMLPR
ncbi:MAG: alpha/beta hydrolase [Coxiellaceae bacterium]|nr:alpha/beta hydrolase [Coxiellaceae bacterium]